MNALIKKWYTRNFPDDTLAEAIDSTATFSGLLFTLKTGGNPYTYIGVNDSTIRERVFLRLANIKKWSYDDVFKLWW